ncbi:MAG: universal stress protein [Actinobacteria bacterium]|nr:universal stress protein [Actinomycetota bacterium]
MEFRSVVCGVDETPAGAVAADRAARIVTPTGLLTLVGVDEVLVGTGAMGAGAVIVPTPGAARAAVDAAAAEVATLHGNVRTVVAEGVVMPAIHDAVAAHAGDLVVVGSHGGGRASGILLGSTATYALHDAPCSVLVAREGRRDGWPASIAIGVDGSGPSLAAYDAAVGLAGRTGAAVRAIAAVPDLEHRALERLRAAVASLEETGDEAVDALVAASHSVDLVVVGSRGLKGLRALGSVSERVAHAATCSVLVVRTGT